MWPYAAIVMVCMIQIVYRTVIGWIVVLLPCIAYTIEIATNPHNGPTNEYVAFLLFGLIPAILLIVAHPFRNAFRRG